MKYLFLFLIFLFKSGFSKQFNPSFVGAESNELCFAVGMNQAEKRIKCFRPENQFSTQIIDNYDDKNNSTGQL